MSGTRAGSAKAQATIRKKFGTDKDGKSLMHKAAGYRGGSTTPSKPRGFAAHPDIASSAGKIGGKISRKKKKIIE